VNEHRQLTAIKSGADLRPHRCRRSLPPFWGKFCAIEQTTV